MTSSRRLLAVAAAAATAVAASLVVRQVFWTEARGKRLLTDEPQVLAMGQKTYRAHCAACHGADLEGQPDWRSRGPDGMLPAPPHDASGHTWHHPDELLFRLTKFGAAKAIDLPGYRSAMPAYDGVLSDAEIVAVLSWIRSQWPRELRERHDQINAQHALE